jgi:chaperonin GroES
MKELKFRPLGDRVWIELVQREETTTSGIVLPDTAQEKPMEGHVLAVGPGIRNEQGERAPVEVKVGDRVLFAKYAGTEIKDGSHKYLIMRESDLLAVVG